MFVACLVDRDRDCKLNVECVGPTVEACVTHLRETYREPLLAPEVLPGEEGDGWFYVEIPGSHLYFKVFAVTVVPGPAAPALPRRQDYPDRDEWRHAMVDAWLREFRSLVRRYVPEYPGRDAGSLMEHVVSRQAVPPLSDEQEFMLQMLFMIGDHTSVFSPYIWSAKYR